MRLLIIPDKFKGSLTSEEVYKAIKKGVEKVTENSHFHFVKASDGGDGFLEAIKMYRNCSEVKMDTLDPLGRKISSVYLYDGQTQSAYIEMANSSGMELLQPKERNAGLTTTYGTGQHIDDALKRGAKYIYVGLGGSATNDGGIGIAKALGYDFLDRDGASLKPIGKHLSEIHDIVKPVHGVATSEVCFYAVNDVKNPLFGENGAAYVYAGQKGADKSMIKELDEGLRNLSEIVIGNMGKDFSDLPGSGAAGGTAFGLKAFLNAEFLSGIDFILEVSGVKQVLVEEKFDYLITGEGKIDAQTLSGKLIEGVVELAKKYHIPVLAVCGMLDVPLNELTSKGVIDVIEIRDVGKSLEYNMENAAILLEEKISRYFEELA